jgi:hypothetical protein
VYATKAQIPEELQMCISDKTARTDEALQKVRKNFTEHVPEYIASEEAIIYTPHATHETPKHVKYANVNKFSYLF